MVGTSLVTLLNRFSRWTCKDVLERPDPKLEPGLSRVRMHNDDTTPMHFVVEVIANVFGKSKKEATELMVRVHHNGSAVCGDYPAEVAEQKVAEVAALAKARLYSLQCTMEKE